ncbi:hypothetical protein C8J57DRAFT_1257197 [Mycena rebaudengoi]|nr:hypothetical protein C8J57DRAFT_1257197 [Mycena rebaudengoi]
MTERVPPTHCNVDSLSQQKLVPEFLAIQARKRDGGLCCFTGRPSNCITWVVPLLLSRAVNTATFSREQCLSLENVFTTSSNLLYAYHHNQITVDPQEGYRVVVFEDFPQVTLLDHLGSPPSSGRFWHASLCWTLAVRLAGCDAHFDGVSSIEARELLDELTWDWNHIPQGPRWSTSAGQEAIRTFFSRTSKTRVFVGDDKASEGSRLDIVCVSVGGLRRGGQNAIFPRGGKSRGIRLGGVGARTAKPIREGH